MIYKWEMTREVTRDCDISRANRGVHVIISLCSSLIRERLTTHKSLNVDMTYCIVHVPTANIC
jgi:hypothetical protein